MNLSVKQIRNCSNAKVYVAITFIIGFCITLANTTLLVRAQSVAASEILPESGLCAENDNNIQTTARLEAGTYQVYVVNSSVFQRFFARTTEGRCTELSIDKQSELVVTDADFITFQMFGSDEQIYKVRDANIVLTKTGDYLTENCTSLNGCGIRYENESFTILPQKRSFYFDMVGVYVYEPVSDKSIKKVIYAVDNRTVYEASSLNKFNTRYVTSGQHSLQRMVLLENGMTLINKEEHKQGYEGDLLPMFISWVYANKNILNLLASILAVFTLLILIDNVRRRIIARKYWRAEHLAQSDEARHALSAGKMITGESDPIRTILGFMKKPALFSVIGVLLFVLTTNYVFTLIKTDGVSMRHTLRDGQQLAVNLTPRTVARMQRGDFYPNRGDIIIFDRKSVDEQGSIDSTMLLVKRVIGLPGDTVKVEPDKVTVTFMDGTKEKTFVDINQPWYRMVNASTYNGDMEVKLGVGEVFVIGDNRDESMDSRFFGPIKASTIYGEVVRPL
ncbi:MAG TPA: signal peptidase I [Candidatus Saccharibacteria bacterium]|jgi:signal peptidase I|nr:signal peptidase I [Candidatus Saccharibacteria bacterium]HMT55582.1 signal peptidase I [Candidatus Saccharibacteria bacterium]